MRKIFRCIPFLLIVLFFTCANQTVFACEDSNQSLRIERGEYRDDILDYIQNNWSDFFGEKELEKYAGSDVIIGEPYGVYSIDEEKMIATKFPIYVNGKCVQVLDVFEDTDGRFTWSATISEDFLKEIDELRQKKGKYRFEVKDDSNGGAPTLKIVKIDETLRQSNQDTLYSDINKPLLKIRVNDNHCRAELRSANYPTEKILPMLPKETQGSKPWCAAYAGAKILSYEFSKDIRAKDIMEWVYWKPWSKPNLDKKSLSDADLIRYAKHLGSKPYYVKRSLYRNEIMEEISNYRMIYAGGRNLNKSKSLHAMVVYGYEKDKYYYYWNPWGEKLRSAMSSNILKTKNGIKYDWIDSIRNFTWK
jgi:hypothetical protein